MPKESKEQIVKRLLAEAAQLLADVPPFEIERAETFHSTAYEQDSMTLNFAGGFVMVTIGRRNREGK